MSAPKVYEAINRITALMAKEGISKNRKNQQQGYAFRGIDDVYSALSAALAENKLCILPRVLSRSVSERETARGGVLFYTVLDVEFDFVSSEDGSKHVVRMVGEAMDSGDKSSNKAMSAAYKYACLQTFCVPTEGDNDADATTHDVAAKGNRREDKGPRQDRKPAAASPAQIKALTATLTEAAKKGTTHFRGIWRYHDGPVRAAIAGDSDAMAKLQDACAKADAALTQTQGQQAGVEDDGGAAAHQQQQDQQQMEAQQ